MAQGKDANYILAISELLAVLTIEDHDDAVIIMNKLQPADYGMVQHIFTQVATSRIKDYVKKDIATRFCVFSSNNQWNVLLFNLLVGKHCVIISSDPEFPKLKAYVKKTDVLSLRNEFGNKQYASFLHTFRRVNFALQIDANDFDEMVWDKVEIGEMWTISVDSFDPKKNTLNFVKDHPVLALLKAKN